MAPIIIISSDRLGLDLLPSGSPSSHREGRQFPVKLEGNEGRGDGI